MRSTSVFRRVAATAAMALVLASGVGAAPSMMGTSVAFATAGNAVTDWNEIAQNAIVVGRPVGSALVLEGIAQAAIYDATVAIEGGYEPFVASPTVDDPASTAAAIAEASRDVLVTLVDDAPGQVDYVQAHYTTYMATIPDGPARRTGSPWATRSPRRSSRGVPTTGSTTPPSTTRRSSRRLDLVSSSPSRRPPHST